MTVATPSNRINYVGNGILTVYPYPFPIFADADLKVYVNGVLKTLTTDYTVSGAGNPSGGNVTFVAPPGDTLPISILRRLALTQGLDLVDNDRLPAESVESELDRLTMIDQQQDEAISRSVKVPVTSTLADVEVPDPQVAGNQGKVVRIKQDGTGFDAVGLTQGLDIAVITTKGDLVQGGDAGAPERLPYGADGRLLGGASGKAAWRNATDARADLGLSAGLPLNVVSALLLTNKTGAGLVAGDVVAFDATNDAAVGLDDVQWSTRPFLVALETIANNAAGLFSFSGVVVTVKVAGTVVRGNYLRKSATSKAVEDSGLGMAVAGRGRVYGALGLALTADSGGFAKAFWFGSPPTSGIMAASLGETTTVANGVDLVTFSNLNIPATAGISLRGAARKTAGAAAAPQLGLKINGGVIITNFAVFSAINQVEAGVFYCPQTNGVGMRPTNYPLGINGMAAFTGPTASGGLTSYATATTALQTGAIASLTLTGATPSGLVTLGVAAVILEVFGN